MSASSTPLVSRDFVRGLITGVTVSGVLFGGLWIANSGSERAVTASVSVPSPSPSASATEPAPVPTAMTESPVSLPSPSPSPSLTTVPTPETAGDPGRESDGAVVNPSAVPMSLPSGDPVTCPPATVTVGGSDELSAALAAAEPGDVIRLEEGVYTGAFVATSSGSADQPIYLCGEPGAILDGGGIKEGYVLHLQGVSHWRVVGFTVRNGRKGVMADGVTSSVVQGMVVEDVGDEGIHLRANSSGNAVLANTVRRTGLRRDKFGEGVYIGSATSNWSEYSAGEPDRSDYNLVQDNDISNTGSESIDVKEGTTGGALIANVLDGSGMTGADSMIDIKGNDWLIEANVGRHGAEEGFQTHRILDGWGSGNTFTRNTIDVDGAGRHIYIHDPDQTANKVSCNNKTGSGGRLVSNVECVA